jgi:hypothetical protein
MLYACKGVHTLFTSQREREGGRDGERRRERERKSVRKREREREYLFFKGMTGTWHLLVI